MIGELSALGGALLFAFHAILARRFMTIDQPARGISPIRPEVGALTSMMTDALTFGLLSIFEFSRGGTETLTARSFYFFLAGGFIGTTLARNLNYFSIRRIGASRSSAIRLSTVLFSTIAGVVLLNEWPGPVKIAGAAIVTFGLWIVVAEPLGVVKKSVDTLGIGLAIGVAVASALGDTVRRAGLAITPSPILGAAIGAYAALAVQAVWAVLRGTRRNYLRDLWRVDVILSALLNTGALLLLFIALRVSTVAVTSVLFNLHALIIALLSRSPLSAESVSSRVILATCICIVGISLILLG